MAENGEPTPPVGGLVPRPDPTLLTTEQLMREVASVREHIASELAIRDERLRGIDIATSLRLELITTLPAAAQKEMAHERELVIEQLGSVRKMIAELGRLTDEKFAGVAQRFEGLEKRSDTESSLNKIALDAAFAAQKEAAAKQDEANQKAIDKSERSTNETIAKNADAAEARSKSLEEKIDDVKAYQAIQASTLQGIISAGAGGAAATSEHRASAAAIYAAIGFVVSLVIAAIVIAGFVAARGK